MKISIETVICLISEIPKSIKKHKTKTDGFHLDKYEILF